MLMIVHGTTPRFSSMEVQHCTALIATSVAAIHWSTTAPSLAIFIRATSGTLLASTYFLIEASFDGQGPSLVFHTLDTPNTSERSKVSMEIPLSFQNLLAYANGVGRRLDVRRWHRREDFGIRSPTRQDAGETTKQSLANSVNRALRYAGWSGNTGCRTTQVVCKQTFSRKSCRGGRRMVILVGSSGVSLNQDGDVEDPPNAEYRQWRALRQNSAGLR